MSSLDAIHYERGYLLILDQLLLPSEVKYIPVKTVQDGWDAINRMNVRGAPAISFVGILSLAVDLFERHFDDKEELCKYVTRQLNHLVLARPTAVNMKFTAEFLIDLAVQMKEGDLPVDEMRDRIIDAAEVLYEKDVEVNKAIGRYGAEDILLRCNNAPVRVLTHCNAGALATGGYGTAVGVIRALAEQHRLLHAYCTETRPYNQGSRLTALEFVHEKLPGTLICDNMCAALMQRTKLGAIVVGADRVVANGDTANKIGTYQLAVLAKHHGVLFYVAAPTSSIDLHLDTGKQIIIEERPHAEMTHIKGHQMAPTGIGVWNPAFDVTPAELITGGIITEFGVFHPSQLVQQLQKYVHDHTKTHVATHPVENSLEDEEEKVQKNFISDEVIEYKRNLRKRGHDEEEVAHGDEEERLFKKHEEIVHVDIS